jgi:hypothetical protein
MAIIQISKIQHRTGANVDLPQLSEGELGFATDEQRLYIGNDPILHPPADGTTTTQTEILTEVSILNFARVDGSANTTLNMDTVQNGQIMAYNDAWINAGGPNNISNINLGPVNYVKLDGGTNGYILQTDGLGNLNWAPSGIISYNIANVSQADPAVVTTQTTHQIVTGIPVTITNVGGMIELASAGSGSTNKYYANVLSDTTFALYQDSGFSLPVDSTGFTSATANTGRTTVSFFTQGSGSSFGANTQLQFSDGSGGFKSSANLTFSELTNVLTVSGNVAATRVTANFVGNLNGAVGATTPNSGAFTNITTTTTANVGGNLNVTGNVSTAGNVTGANFAIGNVSATGTANVLDLHVRGNVRGPLLPNANVTHDLGSPTQRWKDLYISNGTIYIGSERISSDENGVSFTGNALSTSGNLSANRVIANTINGNLVTAAQPNITSVGTLASLSVTGSANLGTVANLRIGGGSANFVLTYGTDNSITWAPTQFIKTDAGGSNTYIQFNDDGEFGGDVGLVYDKTIRLLTAQNYAGNGAFLTSITGSNVTGTVPNATVAATVTTNAQPNITSVGVLASLTTTGNANVANLNASANFTATNGTVSANFSVGNITSSGNFTANVYSGNATGLANIPGANITGYAPLANYSTFAGTVTTNAQPNITSVGTLVSVTATGNVVGGNVNTGGLITATGNIRGANLNATADISAVGNVTGGNVSTAGNIVATGNISGGNLSMTGVATITGNVNTANITATGLISATGNAKVGNVETVLITATGNINGANLNSTGNISAIGNIGGNNITASNNITVTANANVGNISATGTGAVTGNFSAGNITIPGILSVTGNVNSSNISATGNITAANIIGNVRGNFAGNLSVVGTDTGVLFNDAGIANTNAALKFDKANTTLSVGGNVAAINMASSGTLNVTGAIDAGLIRTTGTISATGNVTSGNTNTGNLSVTGTTTANIIQASGFIYSDSDVSGANLLTGGLISATGNITGANFSASGTATIVGNATAGNVITTGIVSTTTLSATGTANIGNINLSGNISAVGNATAFNVHASNRSSAVTLVVTGAASVGGAATMAAVSATDITATTITLTSNANVGNLNSSNTVSAAGNITAGNLLVNGVITSVGNAIVANLATAGLITATGNVLAGNVVTIGLVTAEGNINGGNLTTGGVVTATGTVRGGNLSTSGNINAGQGLINGTMTVGNAVVNGNLTVNGSTVYANVTSVSIKDPVIEMGGNPDGTPLVTNDGKDRGTLLHLYDTAGSTPVDAFMGWDNSNAEFVISSNATFTNEVGVFNTLANLRVNTLIGNITATSLSTTGNVTGANIVTSGQITATGNGTVANFRSNGNISATGNTTTNGNLNAGGFVSAVGNLATSSSLSVFGGASVGSLSTAGVVTAAGNITGGNLAVPGVASISGNVTGGNFTTLGNIAGNNISITNNANVGVLRVTANVGSNLLPAGNGVLNLGSPTQRWKDLYLSNASIYLGNIVLSEAAGGMSTTGNLAAAQIVASNSVTASNLIISGSANLGSVANLKIAGGTSGAVLQTDGTGNVSWGAKNDAAGTNTQVQFNDAGIMGASSAFTFNRVTSTLNVTRIAGSLTTAAQPNITSVGTLASLSTSGNVRAVNTITSGILSVVGAVTFDDTLTLAGNANVGRLRSVSTVSALGNIVTDANLIVTSNATVGNLSTSGTITTGAINITTGIQTTGNANIGNISVSGNVTTTNLTVTSNISVTGTSNTAAINANGAISANGVVSATAFSTVGTVTADDIQVGNVNSGENISATGNLTAGNITSLGTITAVSINVSGSSVITANSNVGNLFAADRVTTPNLVVSTTANLGSVANVTITGGTANYVLKTDGSGVLSWAAPNIASGSNTQVQFNDQGTSNGSSALTFNKTSGKLNATLFEGSGANLTNIPAGNISGTVGSASSATTAATVTTAAQPNITSVGTLTSLTVAGNLNSTVNLSVSGNAFLGTLDNIKITGGLANYVIKTDGTGNLSWVAQPNVVPGGLDTYVQFNDQGAFTGNAGLRFATATGRLTATQFSGNGSMLTGLAAANIEGTVANANYAITSLNSNTANYSNTVLNSAQPNITSVGILSGLAINTDGQLNANANIWDPDILQITGYHGATHGIYFTTDEDGFAITSKSNNNPFAGGSGLQVFDVDNKVGIVNNEYLSVEIDSTGAVRPTQNNLGQNLGGKSGSIGGFSSVVGTPAGEIPYTVTGTYIVGQSATNGSGTGAVFEVYTAPAVAPATGLVYQVRLASIGSGYVSNNTVTINGSELGGTTPANNLVLTVVSTNDQYWKNLYVGDINIKNRQAQEGNVSQNQQWTMVGGNSGVYFVNNLTGTKYLISMTTDSSGPNRLGP